MKIKEGFTLNEVAGNYIACPTGKLVKKFNGTVTLNETGAFIWKQLESEKNESQLVSALMKEYDVDENTASRAVGKVLETLKKEGLVD